MSYSVTSWFLQQLELKVSEPKRYFYISGSDYSSRVVKWPVFKRTAEEIIASKATIEMANDDGEMNFFHERLWTMPNTCQVKVGFTHPTSGDELITIFSGDIKEVKYPQKSKCQLVLRDRLWALGEKKVGDSDNPVTFSDEIPSDIAWTLCTCYGELSTTQNSSNPHIDYDVFLKWAEVFSNDSLVITARFDGQKVSEAVRDLADMTDSAIWTEGEGKLNFKRYTEPSSQDFTITADNIKNVLIKIDNLNLVNKAFVYGGYSQTSDYWTIAAFQINTTSVNTYGLREHVWKNEKIWYTTSAACQNLAQRKIQNLQYPPKKFKIDTQVIGLHRQIGETIRFVDSFYQISSATGWRFNQIQMNIDNFTVSYLMDESIAGDAFFLDVDSLDSDNKLLL